MDQHVSEFGQRLVQLVRDKSVEYSDWLLSEEAGGGMAEKWKALATQADSRALAAAIIPDCVDITIATLLDMIDNSLIALSYRADDGSLVDLEKAGRAELFGWYLGAESWREAYSSQRFVDYTANHPPMKWDE